MPRNQWALIELSKHPNTQDNLHAELLQHFSIGDPSWEQLMNADTLPYLDAVVHEVLRLHPPVPRIIRVVHGFFLVNCSKDSDRDDLWQATEDDILPLSTPLRTSSGSLVNSIHILKGSLIGIPIAYVNRSAVFWGKESRVFKLERWMDAGGSGGDDGRWQEISGYRHLLMFGDGPKACLGRGFTLAEIKACIKFPLVCSSVYWWLMSNMKAVLSVLIRNYCFAFPGKKGVDTAIENVRGIFIRLKVTGKEGIGACVSLKVEGIEWWQWYLSRIWVCNLYYRLCSDNVNSALRGGVKYNRWPESHTVHMLNLCQSSVAISSAKVQKPDLARSSR